MTETVSYTLDVDALVWDLGGPSACLRRLHQMGVKVSKSTILYSRKRGILPQRLLANLLAHQALFGPGPLDINKYVIRQEGPPKLGRAPRPGRHPARRGLWPKPASPPASAASH